MCRNTCTPTGKPTALGQETVAIIAIFLATIDSQSLGVFLQAVFGGQTGKMQVSGTYVSGPKSLYTVDGPSASDSDWSF